MPERVGCEVSSSAPGVTRYGGVTCSVTKRVTNGTPSRPVPTRPNTKWLRRQTVISSLRGYEHQFSSSIKQESLTRERFLIGGTEQ